MIHNCFHVIIKIDLSLAKCFLLHVCSARFIRWKEFARLCILLLLNPFLWTYLLCLFYTVFLYLLVSYLYLRMTQINAWLILLIHRIGSWHYNMCLLIQQLVEIGICWLRSCRQTWKEASIINVSLWFTSVSLIRTSQWYMLICFSLRAYCLWKRSI